MQQLFEAHRHRVFSLCSLLVVEAGLAETLTRSVFAQAMQGALPLTQDAFDSQVVMQSRTLAEYSARASRTKNLPTGADDARLRRAIHALPAAERLLWVMHDVGGVPMERLCTLLHLGAAESFRRLGRARLQILEQIFNSP